MSKIYKHERFTHLCLEYICNTKFFKLRPRWLKNEAGNLMELDIYNKELKLAVEYNGIQHYKFAEFFHDTQEIFEKRLKDDILKEKLCKENNIKLIIVPYTIKMNKIYDYVINQLYKHNIIFNRPDKKLLIKDVDLNYKELIEKICAECEEIKPVSDFTKRITTDELYNNYQSYCKTCMEKARQKSREKCKDNIYKCNQCPNEYKLKDSLTSHVKEAHFIGPIQQIEYKCDECDKIYTDKQAFVQHERSHTEEGQKSQIKRVEASIKKTEELTKIKQECLEKECKGPCKKIKLKTEFHKKADTADGFQSVCKDCQREATKIRKEKK